MARASMKVHGIVTICYRQESLLFAHAFKPYQFKNSRLRRHERELDSVPTSSERCFVCAHIQSTCPESP